MTATDALYSEHYTQVAISECTRRGAKEAFAKVYFWMCRTRGRLLSSMPPLADDHLVLAREAIDAAVSQAVEHGADDDETTLCGHAWVQAMEGCLEGLELDWVHTPGR